MSDKKGINFFKSFASGKTSILSGMKIKSKAEQSNLPQTQTHFGSIEKKEDLAATVKDDSSIKKKSNTQYAPPLEQKGVQALFKKGSKVSESSKIPEKKIQSVVSSPKEKEERIEEKVAEEKPLDESAQIKSNRSSVFSSEEGTMVSEAKSASAILIKKKEPLAEKIEKPQKEPVPARKISTAVEPKKPKKTDREQVLDQINEFTLKLVAIVIQQKETKLQIAEAKSSIEQLKDNIARWQSEQTVSAERQDYEEADRLQTEIEDAEKKVEELEVELSFMEEQVVKQEHEEISLLKTQNGSIKRLSRKMKLIELQLQDDAANMKRQQMETIETMRSKQQAERKKMQRIEKDINYQSQQINEFQREFKKELDGKINPLLETKSKLESKKSSLETEIKELQRKLKEKKYQLTDTTKELKTTTQDIKQTQQLFKEESQKLQQRKNKLEIIQNEKDQMLLTINDIQSNIQVQVNNMDQKVEEKLKEANELAEIAKNIESKQNGFQDELQGRKVALESFLMCGKELKIFENKHKSQREKLKELEYKKGTVAAQIYRLQERKEELKKKVPALEIQQKKYADQKNFKAAGIKKGEIKQINEELTKVKERLDGYLGDEHGLEMELEEMQSGQKQANEEQEILQKNVALAQVKYDHQKLEKLTEYRKQISSSSRLLMKERDRIVKQLEAEIDRMQLEVKYLTNHYDLNSKHEGKHEQQQEQEQEAELQSQGEHQLEEERQQKGEAEDLADYDNEEAPRAKQNNEESQQPQYIPLVLPETEPAQELQDNNEDSGYVPLQLD